MTIATLLRDGLGPDLQPLLPASFPSVRIENLVLLYPMLVREGAVREKNKILPIETPNSDPATSGKELFCSILCPGSLSKLRGTT